MAAAWFKGVQRRICLDYNDTVNKLFHKCFMNSVSIVSIVYLQRHKLDQDFAGGSVPFCASKLTVVD